MSSIGYVVITTEEYKELILENKQLKDKLFATTSSEFNFSSKLGKLQDEMHNILENAIEDVDRYEIYKTLDSYNINSKRLAKYLNENYMNEVLNIVTERAKNKEEKKDE